MKRALFGFLLLLLGGCATQHVLFDDFHYAGRDELARNGWIVRTAPGWPGIRGATWDAANVSIVEGNVLRMTSSTDGTAEHTSQTQLCHQRKYLEGTYAARVRFTDRTVSGPVGDQIVETFYLISPQKAPMDPDYSENDFEYLPEGGWGRSGPTMFVTTWETFQLEPWIADNVDTPRAGSLDGWHTLVEQVGNGKVRYFIDGQQLAEHGGKFYPESKMSINFNLWFVREGFLPDKEMRSWQQDIDWVYFRGGRPQSPAAVEDAVAALRRDSIRFKDTVPPTGLGSPCNF